MDDKAPLRPIGELALFPALPAAAAKKLRKKLALLGSMGLDGEMLAAMIELSGVKLPLDALRYLCGPIVVHESPWKADIAPWLFAQARMERAEIILGDSPHLVGPAELSAVMFPAIMDAPRPGAVSDLYLWSSALAAARHYERPVADIWKSLGGQPIADKEVIKPGGRLWYDYSQLAHEIRRKVIAAQAGRERAEKCSDKPSPPEPTVLGTQLDLFAA